MDKHEALKIVVDCAKLYKQNLENNNLLFLSLVNKTKFNFLEATFLKSNFQHLTGIVTNNKLSPNHFYEKCLDNRLKIEDFKFKEDGTTPLKLEVLPKLMNIQNLKMIGNFNGTKAKLYVDRLVGGITACIGLTQQGKYYVPVTVLKEDIRDIIVSQERIIAIFSKSINSKLYNYLNYSVKEFNEMTEKDLPIELMQNLDKNNMNCSYNVKFIT